MSAAWRRTPTDPPADARRIAYRVRETAHALQYAHEDAVGRTDLQPHLLYLDARGRIRVADGFGWVRFGEPVGRAEPPAPPHMGDEAGIVTFVPAAPQVRVPLRQAPAVAADLHALGLLLHSLLADVPDPPKALYAISRRARNPHDRYGSADEFADDLGRFLDDRPPHALSIRPTGRSDGLPLAALFVALMGCFFLIRLSAMVLQVPLPDVREGWSATEPEAEVLPLTVMPSRYASR